MDELFKFVVEHYEIPPTTKIAKEFNTQQFNHIACHGAKPLNVKIG
jgi:hypothetical protein